MILFAIRDFDPLGLSKRFREFWIFGVKLPLGGEIMGAEYNSPEVNKEIRAVFAAEKKKPMEHALALEKEYPGSLGLSAGSCTLCAGCSEKSGVPCRRPELMRYSIESLGGDVCSTTESLPSTPVKWRKEGKTPEYFILACGLPRR